MAFLGAFTLGIEVLAFGMLQFTENTIIFLALSYLLRYEQNFVLCTNLKSVRVTPSAWLTSFHIYSVLEGASSAIASTTYTVVFIKLYPDKVGAINSWSRTLFGVGYCIGPAIGGLFYDIGGFYLPFLVIGILDIIFSIFTLVALPKLDSEISATAGRSKISITLRIMAKV